MLSSDEPKAAPTLRALLGHGLDPNLRDPNDGEAPNLMNPLLMHNFELQKTLVEGGADPWLGRRGKTDRRSCVEVAIDTGNYEFLNRLLERGSFDRRPPQDIRPLLADLIRQPRSSAADWAENRRLAAGIVWRSGYPHDDPTYSMSIER